MCFWKSKQSKVLRAKRDIIVYKIGDFADEDTFTPYFMNSFTYNTGIRCLIRPDFKSRGITVGFHGYINIIVNVTGSYQLHAVIQKNTEQKLKMIWRILRDRQVVVITEDHGRMYYNWDTRSLKDVCQMCRKVHDIALVMDNK